MYICRHSTILCVIGVMIEVASNWILAPLPAEPIKLLAGGDGMVGVSGSLIWLLLFGICVYFEWLFYNIVPCMLRFTEKENIFCRKKQVSHLMVTWLGCKRYKRIRNPTFHREKISSPPGGDLTWKETWFLRHCWRRSNITFHQNHSI